MLLITTKEAARLLSLSTRSVEHMIATGKIETVYFGKSVRIPRKAVAKIARTGLAQLQGVRSVEVAA